MKIQMQVALLFTVITGVIILFLALTVYYFSSRFAINDFLKRLELRAVVAAKVHFEEGNTPEGAFNELRRQYLEVLPREKEYILQYDSLQGRWQPQGLLPLPASFYEKVVSRDGKTVFWQTNQVHYAGILYRHNGRTHLVVKSAVNEYGVQVLNNLQGILTATFVVSVVVIFTTGIFFSNKAFEPVRRITARVKDISSHNLHLRLESKKGKDEISELAGTFNNMLDRLEAAFETQNNFVSNASHELRTPLTTIIGEADLSLSRPRSNEEYRQSMQVIMQEAEKLQVLTTHLLTLAQSGFDGRKQDWELLRIDELLWEARQAVEEVAPSSRLQWRLESLPDNEADLNVQGNRQLLKLALSNILLNACKYSDNKKVLIELKPAASSILLRVTDEGIGIPAAEQRYIFEPFFRASNTKRYEGHGVGLPLTLT
ncbi:MAG TPA: ATP-binding protein, partial [Chitinophagaceae bacterium]|nr:ATP-binding protein [Chitinophagaceae bacterium]